AAAPAGLAGPSDGPPADAMPLDEDAVPTGEEPAATPAPGVPRGTVLGVHCVQSHFNDPAAVYCAVCGAAMSQSAGPPVPGERPSLGALVLDDATTLTLDRDHVLGRVPGADAAVTGGGARPVELTGDLVSRVHARIVLEGWEVHVEDAGSTNGTFVWGPGATSWTRLPAGGRAPLPPGSVAAFGSRMLRFHSFRTR
ncbi:MAG TPA: FHA domain-containing protein, partial [Pseudonocardiaceae bacterium]